MTHMKLREEACIAACDGIPTWALCGLQEGDLTKIIYAAQAVFVSMSTAQGASIFDRIMPVYDALNRLGVWCKNCGQEVTAVHDNGRCDECQDEAEP